MRTQFSKRLVNIPAIAGYSALSLWSKLLLADAVMNYCI